VAQQATETSKEPVVALTTANDALKGDNMQLKNELSKAVEEAEKAKSELKAAQESMQREFASLWNAVQVNTKIIVHLL
jgi:predicted  nucleic acid-binding Zn-ribbon protein